jgi:DNA (cytosine-5)-methyltransferase 1
MKERRTIPVIDLFAGPGGLGEGFSALKDDNGKSVFKIALSIEKEEYAHQTLELRSFFRQFEIENVPEEYYKHLSGEITRNDLFKSFPDYTLKAKKETWKAELGSNSVEEIDQRIVESLNGEANWVLIGGPPCQAYSVIGRVRQGWKNGLDEDDPRVFLYREYYRILAVHNPPVFIMENVKGLLSSKLKNKLIFEEILYDLENPAESYKKLKGKRKTESKCPGYFLFSLVKKPTGCDLIGKPDFEPGDFIIKAEDYGIPQKRHRVIILGIRKDIFEEQPEILEKRERVFVDKVLKSGLPKVRSGLSKEPDSKENWRRILQDLNLNGLTDEIDFEVRKSIIRLTRNIVIPQRDRGNEYIKYKSDIDYREEYNWFVDKRLKGVCNHSTRAHLKKDLYRYFFASCFAEVKKKSPKLSDFPKHLLPKHKNVGKEEFEDRFRVQIWGEPARTITSHISKDGHYYIHPDPSQCRSLTVREAARIQTFPDNYFFCGPRTSQYIQVGNAVPPLLAKQIAQIVLELFK